MLPQATREQQLRTSQLEEEVRSLRIEKEQLQNQLRQAKSRRRQPAESKDSDAASENEGEGITTGSSACDDTIRTLGRKFVLLNEPFVDPKWFTATFPADTTVLDPDRFKNKKTQLYGILAELHELVPDGFRRYMETVAFNKLVSIFQVSSPRNHSQSDYDLIDALT